MSHHDTSVTRARRWRLAALLLGGLLAATAATAERPGYMKILEHAAESQVLDLSLTSQTSGTIRARRCDYCEELTLLVDADTQVLQGGQRLTLADAERNRDRGATVFYDPETLVVTRILLRNR